MMCCLLEVSRSGFYDWMNREKSKRQKENECLLLHIKALFYQHKKRYGSPRIYDALVKMGIPCSRERVARLMREAGLVSKYKTPKKKKKKELTKEDSKIAKNVLNREFNAQKPGIRWVTDIKYIATKSGWVYLCAILDLHNRAIVGWSVRSHMREELVLEALKMAMRREGIEDELLVHSDRGSQFTSESYQMLLDKHNIQCSMSRKGNCWDNAVMESFFGTLQQELLVDTPLEGVQDSRRVLFEYIELYYNGKRTHSTLGYQIPKKMIT